jgi:hypothetical protein
VLHIQSKCRVPKFGKIIWHLKQEKNASDSWVNQLGKSSNLAYQLAIAISSAAFPSTTRTKPSRLSFPRAREEKVVSPPFFLSPRREARPSNV